MEEVGEGHAGSEVPDLSAHQHHLRLLGQSTAHPQCLFWWVWGGPRTCLLNKPPMMLIGWSWDDSLRTLCCTLRREECDV